MMILLVIFGAVLVLLLLRLLFHHLLEWSEHHDTAFALIVGVVGWGIILGFLSCVIYFFSFQWLPTH